MGVARLVVMVGFCIFRFCFWLSFCGVMRMIVLCIMLRRLSMLVASINKLMQLRCSNCHQYNRYKKNDSLYIS